MDEEILHIKITVVAARKLKNMDLPLIGKNDAYATVAVDEKINQTRTISDAGKEARWDESFDFVITPSSEIVVKVFDQDLIKPDLIGEITLTTLLIYEEGSMESWFSLTKREKSRGEIYLVIQRYP